MDPKQSQLDQERLERASTEEIRSGIRHTRREMDDTLDELGDRLHPRNLLEDVFDFFREGSPAGSVSRAGVARTSKRVGRSVVRELKAHPLPALLVGAGIAWWIIDAASDDEEDGPHGGNGGDARRRTRLAEDDYPESIYADPAPYGTATRSETGDGEGPASMGAKISEATASAKDKAADAASGIAEKVSGAASAVGEKLSDAGDAVRSAVHSGKERGGRYSASVSRSTRRNASIAQDRFREVSDDYPLAVGGAFLAAGLLVGLLLPRTESEDEWMGEASDEVKDEARAKSEELVERGKTAAAETADAAMKEAEARGVTPGNLMEKAEHVIAEAVAAGKKTAQDEGIGASDLKAHAAAIGERTKETAKQKGQEQARQANP